MIKDLYKEGYTQNRELSWLQFDMRCLNEAKDKTVPDIERLKFVEIYTSNLTEFFMVRVGSLYDMDKVSVTKVDNKSGLSPKGQLNAIYPAAKRGLKKRDVIFEELRKRLARAGIEDIPVSECDKNEVKYLRKYFRRSIAPLLTPQIVPVAPGPTMPALASSKSMCMASPAVSETLTTTPSKVSGLSVDILTLTSSPSVKPHCPACAGVMWMWRRATIAHSFL